jgi:hypothetical protein
MQSFGVLKRVVHIVTSLYLTGNTLLLRYKDQPVIAGETVAVYSENHTEHTNTLGGQNAEFWYVKAGGTYCDRLA